MNKIIRKGFYAAISVASVFTGFFTTGCSNEDDITLSRAVLASADVLEYDVKPQESKIIRITSDGDWTCECPEWITVNPSSGHAGQTEVEITVTENYRDGAPDVPRKFNVLFKGRDLRSFATVIIRQNGNKFRNPSEYSIDDMEKVKDEEIVKLSGMDVVALTGNGFIATDGNRYAYIKNPAVEVSPGQKLNVIGVKMSSDEKLAYVIGERIEITGKSEAKDFNPEDISINLDSYSGLPYSFVSLTGEYDGANISVDGQILKVSVTDANESLRLNLLIGHNVKVTGFYAGTSSPIIKIIPSEVEDKGAMSTIYFNEDFEWLEPWSLYGDGKGTPAADIVGCDQADTYQPQIVNSVVDGVTAEQELLRRGYELLRDCAPSKTPGECIYIQRNYLKFGKTGYQGGMILPAMESLGNGVNAPTLSFDWYTQRQGTGVFDPTEIVVIITTDGNETRYNVPKLNFADNAKAEWTHANIPLTGCTLTKDTRITIRNIDSQLKSTKALRWHIDNITLSKSR